MHTKSHGHTIQTCTRMLTHARTHTHTQTHRLMSTHADRLMHTKTHAHTKMQTFNTKQQKLTSSRAHKQKHAHTHALKTYAHMLMEKDGNTQNHTRVQTYMRTHTHTCAHDFKTSCKSVHRRESFQGLGCETILMRARTRARAHTNCPRSVYYIRCRGCFSHHIFLRRSIPRTPDKTIMAAPFRRHYYRPSRRRAAGI